MSDLFDVIEAPIQNALTGEIIPDRKGLFVNNKCVNVVSNSRYKVVQPRDIYDRFEEATGLEINRVITNTNHGSMLLSANYQGLLINNEEHQLSLTFYTGHNNQYSTFLTLGALRIACMNQLPVLVGAPDLHLIRCKHIHHFNFDQLGSIIETLPRRVANFEAQCQRLKESKLSLDDFLASYVEFYKLEDTAKKDKAIASIMDVYKRAPGQEIIEDNTAYKAFHAITYDLTHNVKQTKNQLEKVNVQNQKTVHKFFVFMESKQLIAA